MPSESPLRRTVSTTFVPASETEFVAEVKANPTSSSTSVIVMVLRMPRTAPVGLLRINLNDSLDSTTESFRTLMLTVLVVSPGANVRVPVAAV